MFLFSSKFVNGCNAHFGFILHYIELHQRLFDEYEFFFNPFDCSFTLGGFTRILDPLRTQLQEVRVIFTFVDQLYGELEQILV